MCLAGAVIASWSLTSEMAGSRPFTIATITLSLNSVNSMKTFREKLNYQVSMPPSRLMLGVNDTGVNQ